MTRQTTNQTKQSKAGWTRRVSRKFYQSICKQVHEVSQLTDDITESDVMQCFDDYIDTGRADANFTDMETVVFTLLQPLIDKAMARSMRARAAAACRREAAQSATATTSTEALKPSSDPVNNDSDANHSEPAMTQAETTSPTTATETSDATEVPVTTAETPPSSPQTSREEKRAMRREAALIRRHAKHLKRLSRRSTPNLSEAKTYA